ncbi:MAG: 16S rRNA (adenine(1518)-N(6)/adenine(1519)-N(6))-dimethyltransferase RsmA [Verrucomicrobiales bacterium]|jgi:16S rRNA (adenine1518-N6/adenine1519-N6)-dimethyltransferase|nr:16S rRNA (adenine(1518)-N(6)/adenine(1519)-N(6))-dimethyltransferase RsmA [Verrucomicrobiales bacterium]
MTLTEIKQALADRHLRPLASLGQNFLFDQNICRQIVAALAPAAGDRVLEIGPGLGALTERLLELDLRLTALEIDKGLCAYLRDKFGRSPNFTLVEGDAAQTLPTLSGPDRAIGNLPYNVATPLLVTLLQLPAPPRRCVFMLQKEMAARLAAAPRTKSYGAVSVLLQTYYRVEPLRTLRGQVFYPAPAVDSVVVALTLREDRPVFGADRQREFYQFVRRGFSQRRKKLRNLIPAFAGDQRAEELTVSEWGEFFQMQSEKSKMQNFEAGMNLEEVFDVVDEYDRVIGSGSRAEVHARGLRHRAAHVLIFNADGDLLIQLRSPNKDRHPNTWDSSAAGHVDSGEDYLAAAIRETREELGVTVSAGDELREIAYLRACAETGQEFVKVYEVRHDGPFRLQAAEVAAARWIAVPALERWMRERAADFAPALPYLWREVSPRRH